MKNQPMPPIARCLFVAACSCLASAQVSPVLPVGLRVEIDPAFVSHVVQACGATSPEFQPKVLQLLGANNAGVAAAALPYCVVITNAAASPISAVVTRYSGTGVNGQPLTGEQVQRIGNMALSAPGSTLIFSHDPNLTQALFAKRNLNQCMSVAASGLSTLARSKTMAVVLDSVVFGDGAVVGPDATGIVHERRQSVPQK